MAEGGEGEEEIQFLRTVSPSYVPVGGLSCPSVPWRSDQRKSVKRNKVILFYIKILLHLMAP